MTNRFQQPKKVKNIETDELGDQYGRIHVGQQNLDKIQTRKMKGLKRRASVDEDDENEAEESEAKRAREE